MNIAEFCIASYRRFAPAKRLSLLAGTWMLACAPVFANPVSTIGPVLLAQASSAVGSLQFGSSGQGVIELQRALDRNGLFPYAIDGVYGGNTSDAVRRFQRIRRLEATGIADAETLEALGIDPASLLPRMVHPVHGAIGTDVLRFGDNSNDVAVLQAALNDFGFGLFPDGDYGEATLQAVRTYQRAAGILQSNGDVSGVADQETLTHMGFELTGEVAQENRYVAVVIGDESDLTIVRQDFPEAVVVNHRLGKYISLGRYAKRSQANAKVDEARSYGYDSRVIRD
ncbi:MAG: peptidoglycan-binding protein [Cyanobacteria bacterium J06642_11]